MAAAPLAADSYPRPGASRGGTGRGPARARAPIRQSVMASVWGNASKLSFEERCQILARIGFKGVDLPSPEQVPILKQYGLAPAMMTGAGTTFPGRADPQGAPRQVRRSVPRRDRHVRGGRLSQPDRDARRAPRHVARGSRGQRCGDPEPRQGLRRAEGRDALHGDHQLQGRRGPANGPGRSITSTGGSTSAARSTRRA